MTQKNSAISARERIVETALDLFYRQGYLATGVNQIIAESRVAKATFYALFPSKEALCIAYLEARHKRWMSWLKEKVEDYAPGRERLLGVFAFLEQWMQESDFRGCAFLNIATEIPAHDSRVRDQVIIHKNALQRYLAEIIQTAVVGQGEAAGADSDALGRMVYVLVEGAIVASQNYHATWPIEAARQAATGLLGEGDRVAGDRTA